MDKTLFQFDSIDYDRTDVEGFSFEHCEKLSNIDSNNVTKFDLNYQSIEVLLNDGILDVENCWYRIFE